MSIRCFFHAIRVNPCQSDAKPLQIEDGFWPHVEKEVEDAEVGQETMLQLKDLIVGPGLEIRVGGRVLGTDGFAEIPSDAVGE